MSDLPKHKPVDHRPFITGFDLTGYMDAVNAEWKKRAAALKLELASTEDQVTTLTERVSHLEERQKNCSRNLAELDRIHEYLGELGKRYRRWWLDGMKNDDFGNNIGEELLMMRDAWEEAGNKWPWETDDELNT